MSRPTLREYYDDLTREDIYYYQIKHKMKKGARCWKIKIDKVYDSDDYDKEDFDDCVRVDDIFITDGEIINLVNFARNQGLTVEYSCEVHGGEWHGQDYLIISW